ncbi:helix-turn-helix domain-containing protein [Sphingosinicella sp. LHD-64]|uniref:MerR family transcriptional regulator n=1 Tax=Sphingosinicella sp. LHD-64 TaxID=3072139 RepID=UPI00280D19DD|nr:helix-turn-helix domain-containing protein [Sphingosinicella sp. LHD-64]MDQ8757454.1 helix-turn-helix domain-containing protein [Sphingosinicella sp. LHD-64]
MKIGELSKATGTNVETVRYYERIGLLPKPNRTGGNYRDYAPQEVDRLRFIRHARGLGFDISDIRSLLDLSEHPERDCCEVDQIATSHLASVESKIRQLGQLQQELVRMLRQCRGGQMADCRILLALADRGLAPHE